MKIYLRLFLISSILYSGILSASQIERIYRQNEVEQGIINYFDFSGEFNIEIEVPNSPLNVINKKGESVWLFNFNLQNRMGIVVESKYLKEGDYLLEPLKIIGSDGKQGYTLYPKHHTITKKDLLFLNTKHFRKMYEVTGVPLDLSTLKEGETFEAYKRSYDYSDDDVLIYEPSGFETVKGENIIENGTVLEEKHLAMIFKKAILPARVQYKVNPKLSFFIRTDWPKEAYNSPKRFWVFREDEPKPLYLLRYQLEENDTLIGDVIRSDRTIICNTGEKLQLEGDVNSIQAIKKYTDAFMVHKKTRAPITSIDPISLVPNSKVVEPSDLVIAPQNQFEFSQPYFIKNKKSLSDILSKGIYSYSRAYTSTGDIKYPSYIYLTHYTLPFLVECIAECDELLDISDSLLKGKKHCQQCKRHKHFQPYVHQPVNVYTHLNQTWEKDKITCVYCKERFYLSQAYLNAGKREDGSDFDPISVNFIHPKDLIAGKSVPVKEISYFMNGDEIIIEPGEPLDEEMIDVLKKRSISPIYLSKPTELKSDAAQCPYCFGWNTKPLSVNNLSNEIGTSEVRKGAVSFKNIGHKTNRLDLVVFGLSFKKEPTTGRSLALVATYERYGDEHFQFISGWKLISRKWKYLYPYNKPLISNLPIAADPSGAKSTGESNDAFIDDL